MNSYASPRTFEASDSNNSHAHLHTPLQTTATTDKPVGTLECRSAITAALPSRVWNAFAFCCAPTGVFARDAAAAVTRQKERERGGGETHRDKLLGTAGGHVPESQAGVGQGCALQVRCLRPCDPAPQYFIPTPAVSHQCATPGIECRGARASSCPGCVAGLSAAPNPSCVTGLRVTPLPFASRPDCNTPSSCITGLRVTPLPLASPV